MRTDIFYVPRELTIQRVKSREGPPITFVVYQKDSSRVFADKSAALKFIHWPKSTPTGQKIVEWFDQFDEEGNIRDKQLTIDPQPKMVA